MEGTTIGRSGTTEGAETESDLEAKFVEAFGATQGLHLVWTSSRNIDRLVTVYRAGKRTGRLFVIDLYTAVVLEATGRDTLPQSWWDDVRLYVPFGQRLHVRENELFDDLQRHSANRVFPEHLTALADRAVMLFRPHMMRDRGIGSALNRAKLTYSMWDGYLKQQTSRNVLAWLEARGIPFGQIHTSGHAPASDLQRLATALAPQRLVPIHSFETARCGEYFANVERREDGVWWTV